MSPARGASRTTARRWTPRARSTTGRRWTVRADLRQALLKRSGVLVQTFTENLMTFALGRRLGYEDMPAVRGIVREAEAGHHKLSAFVLAIVKSPAFRMKSADASSATAAGDQK